jgi:hypothetical protein
LWRAGARQFVRQLTGLLLIAGCAVGAAQAQSVGEADAIDPPGRVGTITLLAGPVEMVDLQTGSREAADLNWPITAGWRLETGRLGRAEVRIGSTALRMDGDTTVDFARLDDHFVQIAVLRGSLALRLRSRDVLDEFEVLTQRERIVFDDVGRYRIDVDRAPELTAVTAFSGRARIVSGDSTFAVTGNQRGEVGAPPMTRFQLAAASADRFDDWVAARDARDDSLRSAAYVSRETTGVELLDDYGDWRTVNDYGPVWFPRTVAPGWAPYRYGRWAWVDPWGWTWVDEAPWGFAPFHYGRWVVIGGTWGWVPGVIVPRPVYAPALVAWFGSPGVSVSIGAPIGWFPLGPREAYVPAYRHSPRYLRVVNVQNVPNIERVTIVQTPRYANRSADRSTWLPGDRFGRRDPVDRSRRPPPSEWRQYIARPQPPANVPNTKRRQQFEVTAPAPSARPPAPAHTAPVVRPPVPRAVEAPRARPAPPAVVQPGEQRGRGESTAPARDERRFAPRAPAPAPAAPAPSAPERARPRDRNPAPAQSGAVDVPASRGRGELGMAPRETARPSPRPTAPTVAPSVAPPPAAPVSTTERGRPGSGPPERPVVREEPDERRFNRPASRPPREQLR